MPSTLRRIAVSGSAGTGKTTLGTALAEALQVPFVPEGIRTRLEGGLDLHRLTRDQHRSLLVELFDETLTAMDAAERRAGGFVVDRAALDFAAFWLYFGFGFDAAETDGMMERVRAATARYDRILMLPWGVLPLVEDGIRTANPWVQLHFQALVEGLEAHLLPAGLVVRPPAGIVAPDERLRWALTAIRA